MFVGLVLRGRIDRRSGGFLYDRLLIDGLRDRGHAVGIVTLPWDRSYARQLATNASPHRFRRLRHAGFDVILQDALAHPSLPVLNRRLVRHDAPPIVALVHYLRHRDRSGIIDRTVSRAIERRYLGSVDGVICNSHATRRTVTRMASADSAIVAYPGKDRLATCRPSPGGRSTGRAGALQVLYVGNVIPRKGLLTVAEGLAGLESPWRLAVVGDHRADPEYTDRIRRRVSTLDVADRLSWRGPVSDAALADAYREADVLAMPSRYEPFGLVYVEAMGFGAIPLASTAGAGSELITDGVDGLLVPPADPEAIRSALAPLAAAPERLDRLAAGAAARYETLPSWASTTDRIVRFLGRVAA